MRRQSVLGPTAVMVFLLAAPAWAFGPDYNEGPIDAGNTPSTARTPTGLGSMSSIGGRTGTEGPADFQDMYLIQIDDPAAFRASTVAADGGMATFDTEVWLFRLDGRGLLGNDDDLVSGTPQSKIKQPATDATAQVIPGPGLYYLAISGRNDNPLSTGGVLEIFNQILDTEISGPDGPGFLDAILDWNSFGETGEYIIALEGVSFPHQSIPTYSEWTLIILTTLLLAAGVVIFRRQATLQTA